MKKQIKEKKSFVKQLKHFETIKNNQKNKIYGYSIKPFSIGLFQNNNKKYIQMFLFE